MILGVQKLPSFIHYISNDCLEKLFLISDMISHSLRICIIIRYIWIIFNELKSYSDCHINSFKDHQKCNYNITNSYSWITRAKLFAPLYTEALASTLVISDAGSLLILTITSFRQSPNLSASDPGVICLKKRVKGNHNIIVKTIEVELGHGSL